MQIPIVFTRVDPFFKNKLFYFYFIFLSDNYSRKKNNRITKRYVDTGENKGLVGKVTREKKRITNRKYSSARVPFRFSYKRFSFVFNRDKEGNVSLEKFFFFFK